MGVQMLLNVIDNVDLFEDNVYKMLTFANRLFQLILGLIAVIALTSKFGAHCGKVRIYPLSYYFLIYILLIKFVFCAVLYK